ncbi:MAG: NADP(H)-dependent aldo-keto reductase [Vampirovibrionales bacterium]|nr:NADP(H)-dependent aldo-keto reductase [Vampirovibrionales bacterium]
MEYRALGLTDLRVSVICLGTMTWGEQNSPQDAHAQLDRALALGVNFIDAAELYPVPARAETSGSTESIIGDWLAARGNRDQVILATKVAGPSAMSWIRAGQARLNRAHIRQALEGSLRRLQTDYIDLYQLHWPDRRTNYFGRLGYEHQLEEAATPLEESLAALNELAQEGKIRHIGLSNETPWGTMRCLQLAGQGVGPRVVSVQNPYNLLNRSYEIGMAEVSCRESCGLLAYSPLAFGLLSGKYQDGARPPGARMTIFGPYFDRYASAQSALAVDAYVTLARKQNLSPAQMSLAFVNSRPFVTSSIIGATSLAQLEENIASLDVTLDEEALDEIESIHRRWPNPAP